MWLLFLAKQWFVQVQEANENYNKKMDYLDQFLFHNKKSRKCSTNIFSNEYLFFILYYILNIIKRQIFF